VAKLFGLAWPQHPHELPTDRRMLLRFALDAMPVFETRARCRIAMLHGLASFEHDNVYLQVRDVPEGEPLLAGRIVWSVTLEKHAIAQLGTPTPVWFEDCLHAKEIYESAENPWRLH
jgi:hypothetical protein